MKKSGAGNKTQGAADRRREEARREALAEIYEVLAEAAKAGRYGSITVEAHLQDGVVRKLDVTRKQTIALPRLRVA